ncbi:Aminotran-1-2 domain-containing protein [Mycena indigotica]|uniref:Aminotran-1-2 domain-containing protein n=1 Tax=Mycena indigotica TaxID=2126181 RepID=A0A8H6S3K6_9AGAR|nr:Aminotran-1-2 domain-containing protein [Mycena indigotica]KAF7290680.1 Aminotran-1-2 domain-containing protein [Mycena indigotica]
MPTVFELAPFLSKRSALWKACGIRGLFPLESIPGMISLLAGRPNPATFPFESITMKLRPTLVGIPLRTTEDSSDPLTITLEGEQLTSGLQYGLTPGAPNFVKWLEEFQTFVHKRAPNLTSWSVTVGSGSQDLMYKACDVLVDDGDFVLMEAPVYPGVLGFFAALPCQLVEVAADSQGLNPASLDSILSTWGETHPGQRFPKFLYTIPSGSNPTGASIPEARKVEVLRLVKKYNILLLEDDAYAFLYYGPEGQQARSYFALEPEVNDEEGRIIRFDSLSKVFSSGMRLGYMTAHPTLATAVNMITSNTNLQPNSLAQLIAYSLLSRWGPQGFLDHCKQVASLYEVRRDAFERLARKYLADDGLAEWTTPVAGMFLYIKLIADPDGTPESDARVLILERAVAKGVLAVPGTSFMPLAGKSPFVRVSFSIIEEADAEEACRRLREVMLEARAEAKAKAIIGNTNASVAMGEL